MRGVLLPAVAQSGQRRVPRVFELGESKLVEDVVNAGSGRHLQQKQKNLGTGRTGDLMGAFRMQKKTAENLNN